MMIAYIFNKTTNLVSKSLHKFIAHLYLSSIQYNNWNTRSVCGVDNYEQDGGGDERDESENSLEN